MATIYLHGFLSSPDSKKGRILALEHKKRGIPFFAPDLTMSPEQVSAMLTRFTAGMPPEELTVVGSSLGGFYATWLAEKTGCRAVLLNPVVRPWELVRDFLGEQETYGGKRCVVITEDYADQLLRLDTPAITMPTRYLVLLSTSDEVLDWHEADRKYQAAKRVLVPQGDHQISNFDQYSPAITDFCAMRPEAALSPDDSN